MTTLAMVGCAHIHAPDFCRRLNERPDVDVTAVWDHDGGRAQAYGEKLKARVVGDPDAVWSDPKIDGVVIASETVHHPVLVKGATAARKHLFVEKPLGVTSSEASAMAEAIKKAGVIFQTGYFRRSQRANRTLKSLLATDRLGKITRVRDVNMHHGLLGGWFDTDYRWMADTSLAGVGAFGDMGAHAVDLLIWLLGRVERATGLIDTFVGRYADCDETGEALVKFQAGANGTVGAGWLDFGCPVSTLVSGTKGLAYVKDDELFLNQAEITGRDGFQPYAEFEHDLPHAFDLFLDALAGKESALVPVDEAAHGVAVMEAIYQGARERKWVDVR